VAESQPLGESRWPPVVAVVVFVVLNVAVRLWLPTESVIAVPWLLPSIELVLLGALLVSDPIGIDRRATWLRRVEIGLVLLLVVAALWATVILTDRLISGAPQTSSAGYLLASGALVLVGNNLAFALLYWEFDSGGRWRGSNAELTTRGSHSRSRSTRTSPRPGGARSSSTTCTSDSPIAPRSARRT
jgi:hypothetical protein